MCVDVNNVEVTCELTVKFPRPATPGFSRKGKRTPIEFSEAMQGEGLVRTDFSTHKQQIRKHIHTATSDHYLTHNTLREKRLTREHVISGATNRSYTHSEWPP